MFKARIGTIASAVASRRADRRAARERRRDKKSEVRRFTNRTRRRRRAWAVPIVLIGSLALFVAVGAYSPLMAVRVIDVEGAVRVDSHRVVESLAGQLGRPLPLVDQGEVRSALEAFPQISTFSIENNPPDTIVVRIVERQPIGVVHTSLGFDLVDPAGVVIESAAQRVPGYPLLQVPAASTPAFRAATTVVATLPSAIGSRVDRVLATTPDDVTLVLAGGGQTVLWGSADDSDLKGTVLDRLLTAHGASAAVTYDVSSPSSAVVR